MLPLQAMVAAVAATTVAPPQIIDLRAYYIDTSMLLAIQVCVGLRNRDLTSPGVYTINKQVDFDWLTYIAGVRDIGNYTVDARQFIRSCVQGWARGRWIRYDISVEAQRLIVPNIITLAGVLDAVPLDDAAAGRYGATNLVLDTPATPGLDSSIELLAPLEATTYVYQRYLNRTTGLAKLNPGFHTYMHPLFPKLVDEPDLGLVDYIVQRRLFALFLLQGCIPGMPAHRLFEKIVTENRWVRPIAVYGYDDTWSVGADAFEAETDCVKQHNLGAVASPNVNNLGYYSRSAPIVEPLAQAARPAETEAQPQSPPKYDPNTTYVSIVIGDGDNIGMVLRERHCWMLERARRCGVEVDNVTFPCYGERVDSGHGMAWRATRQASSRRAPTGAAGRVPSRDDDCFPLAWSISPHLLYLAPDVLRWFYSMGRATKRDWFVLPPSGHLYAYPTMMHDADQAAFVRATERDALLMSTSATVAWEFFGTWPAALSHYFPRYVAKQTVRGFFATNVPFMLPVLPFGLNRQYLLVGADGSYNSSLDATADPREVDGKGGAAGGGARSPSPQRLPAEPRVVVFRPNEWRGKKGQGFQYLNATQMALVLSEPELVGGVTHLYVTADGGANVDLVYRMVRQLKPHVQVVDPDTLVEMALQRG